jgi:hypothetical protein
MSIVAGVLKRITVMTQGRGARKTENFFDVILTVHRR